MEPMYIHYDCAKETGVEKGIERLYSRTRWTGRDDLGTATDRTCRRSYRWMEDWRMIDRQSEQATSYRST